MDRWGSKQAETGNNGSTKRMSTNYQHRPDFDCKPLSLINLQNTQNNALNLSHLANAKMADSTALIKKFFQTFKVNILRNEVSVIIDSIVKTY